ncbi:MAG: hypothetical protein ABI559_07975 [Chloroflexota bacterium]
MATTEDDARHTPGPNAKPLWNESYWFTFVDPKAEIAFAARFGMLPVKRYGNFYLLISDPKELLYSHIDNRAKLPEYGAPLSMGGYTIDFVKDRERFHLTYDNAGVSADLTWESSVPTGMWPHAPVPVDESPRHIEGSGRVKGTLRVNETTYEIDCPGHRDHSFGGERDWSKIHRWDYLSGDFGDDFWFNAVRIKLDGMAQPFHVGCLWDGKQVLALPRIQMDVKTAEGETRATGVEVRATDENGGEHHISGEMAFASGNVWFGPACLREGYAKWTYNGRTGYGVHEHGYVEGHVGAEK